MEKPMCESLKIRENYTIEIMCYLDAYNFPGEWDCKQHAEHFSLHSLFPSAAGTKQPLFCTPPLPHHKPTPPISSLYHPSV